MSWKNEIKKEEVWTPVNNVLDLIEELNGYVKDLEKADSTWTKEQLMDIEEFLNKAAHILEKGDFGHKEPERAADWHLDNMGE